MISTNDDLKALVRTIPDFPRPGIQFRDITALLLDAQGFAAAVERLAFKIEEKPDLTLNALRAELAGRGVVVSCDTLWRFIRRQGKSFKKNRVRNRAESA